MNELISPLGKLVMPLLGGEGPEADKLFDEFQGKWDGTLKAYMAKSNARVSAAEAKVQDLQKQLEASSRSGLNSIVRDALLEKVKRDLGPDAPEEAIQNHMKSWDVHLASNDPKTISWIKGIVNQAGTPPPAATGAGGAPSATAEGKKPKSRSLEDSFRTDRDPKKSATENTRLAKDTKRSLESSFLSSGLPLIAQHASASDAGRAEDITSDPEARQALLDDHLSQAGMLQKLREEYRNLAKGTR